MTAQQRADEAASALEFAATTNTIARLIMAEQERLIEQWLRAELPKFVPCACFDHPIDVARLQADLKTYDVTLHHIVPSRTSTSEAKLEPFYCIMQGDRIVSRFQMKLTGWQWPAAEE